MDQEESQCERLLVAAFDFGTTYSGYAFSFRNEHMAVKTNQNWIAGSEKLISLKTPTCVLLDPDKNFHSFGFDAENKFTSMAEDNEHHEWYFFRRFKMVLHDSSNLTRGLQIEDIGGKKCCALDIFSISIRYLKDHLIDMLKKQTTGVGLLDIDFVITVPAIWDDKAKQFMREAAIGAGIPTNQLRIALEPEAASLWCQTISTEYGVSGLEEIGMKYMVVDLGGGTADITVHQKIWNGSLKEVKSASGGAWGGNEVDKNYINMLKGIVGEETMERFKREEMGDYFDILRDFETKKRAITTDKEGKMTFKIPAMLKEMFEEKGKSMKSKIAENAFGDNLIWAGDKIRLAMTVAKSWFHEPIQSLITHVQSLLNNAELKDVKKILLVGGFGECQLVQDAFRKHFKCIHLVIPEDAGLAVLKGAVRFGHFPKTISQRISRLSYGTEGWPEFNPCKHQEDKKVEYYGKTYCKEVYYQHVQIGEEIRVGQIISICKVPFNENATMACFRVYCSSEKSPSYVTDMGCKQLGEIKFDLPEGTTKDEKMHYIDLVFGDTELHVKIRIVKTGEEFETYVDCF